LHAAILEFIFSLITFCEFFNAPKYLKFWNPSSTYPSITETENSWIKRGGTWSQCEVVLVWSAESAVNDASRRQTVA